MTGPPNSEHGWNGHTALFFLMYMYHHCPPAACCQRCGSCVTCPTTRMQGDSSTPDVSCTTWDRVLCHCCCSGVLAAWTIHTCMFGQCGAGVTIDQVQCVADVAPCSKQIILCGS
jgi:hypothetical protein